MSTSQNQSRNYYQTLGIDPSASPDDIKTAFRRLARQFHPDVNPNNPNAESQFKRVNEAHAVLASPEKRRKYDQTLGVMPYVKPRPASTPKTNPQPAAQHAQPSRARTAEAPRRSSTDRSSEAGTGNGTKAAAGPHFKDMFDSLFKKDEPKDAPQPQTENGAPRHEAPPKKQTETYAPHPPPPQSVHAATRGEDVTVDTPVSPTEAEHGAVKTVAVEHAELCKRCSGLGQMNGQRCTVCHGAKQQLSVRKIDVRIPPGVKQGSKIRVAKEGGRGVTGGDSGDLYLIVRIHDVPNGLTINGLTVSSELTLSIPEAVLGTVIEVPTLHGKTPLTVPPGTASGSTILLKGLGVAQHGITGDQWVTVQVAMPTILSPEEKQHYEALAALHQKKKAP